MALPRHACHTQVSCPDAQLDSVAPPLLSERGVAYRNSRDYSDRCSHPPGPSHGDLVAGQLVSDLFVKHNGGRLLVPIRSPTGEPLLRATSHKVLVIAGLIRVWVPAWCLKVCWGIVVLGTAAFFFQLMQLLMLTLTTRDDFCNHESCAKGYRNVDLAVVQLVSTVMDAVYSVIFAITPDSFTCFNEMAWARVQISNAMGWPVGHLRYVPPVRHQLEDSVRFMQKSWGITGGCCKS